MLGGWAASEASRRLGGLGGGGAARRGSVCCQPVNGNSYKQIAGGLGALLTGRSRKHVYEQISTLWPVD